MCGRTCPKRSRCPYPLEKFKRPSRRSCAARRSGKRLTRAELPDMVRRARPAPSGRLQCRCRAHCCARACRILHAGRRWPHARAERRPQLFDVEEPSQQLEAAAERSTTVVAGGGLLAGATVGAASCCGGETSDARTQTGMLMQPPAEHLPRCLHVVLHSMFCQYCVWLVRFRLLCPQRQAQKHGEAARSE